MTRMTRWIRRIFPAIILAFCLCSGLIALHASPAAAEDAPLWQITHADGTVEYSSALFPFSSAQDGDLFALQRDLSATAATAVDSAADYTIDLRGRTLSFDNGYGVGGLTFTGTQKVRVLAENTTFFADPEMSILIGVNGTAEVVFDGGEGGFAAYSPCFVNADGSAAVTVRGGMIYKNSGHVMGAVCSRNEASLSLDRCAVYAPQNFSPLYVTGRASLSLNATLAYSESGYSAYASADNGVVFSLSGGSMLYGSTNIIKTVRAEEGTRISTPIGASLADDRILSVIATTAEVNYSVSDQNGVVEPCSQKLSFSYIVTRQTVASADPTPDAVWARRFGDGVTYYANPYAPFTVPFAEGVSFSLVSDVEIPFFPEIRTDSDLSLDLSGRTIRATFAVPTVDPPALFSYSGIRPVTLDLRGSVFTSERSVFFSAPNARAVNVLADNAVFFSPAFSCPRADLALMGGYFASEREDVPVVYSSSLTLTDTQILTGAAGEAAVSVSGAVGMNASRVFATAENGVAVSAAGDLTLDRDSTVYGAIEAAKLSAEDGAIFSSTVSVGESTCFFVAEKTPYTLLTYSLESGVPVPHLCEIVFTSIAASGIEGVKVNLTIGAETALNLYVPRAIADGAGNFSVRIMLNGICYEGRRENASPRLIDGEQYYRFTYRYLYHANAARTASVGLVADGATVRYEFRVADLLLAEAQAASEEDLPAIASYMAFSFAASSLPDAEELLAPYAEYLCKETAYHPEVSGFTDYIRAVVYDPEENLYTFVFAQDFTGKATAVYRYNGKEQTVTVNAWRQDRFAIPCFRLSPKDTVDFTFVSGAETVEISVGVMTFAAITDATVSADLFDLYLSFLATLK